MGSGRSQSPGLLGVGRSRNRHLRMQRTPVWFDSPSLQDISDIFSSPPLHFIKAFHNLPNWFHDSLMGHLSWFGKHWPLPGVSDSVAHRRQPFKQNRRRKRIPGLHPRPPETNCLLVQPRHCRSNNLPTRFWCALKSENLSRPVSGHET